MRGAVGRELRRLTSFPISESDIRRWAVAVYFPETPPAEFWDAEYAAGTPAGGIVAPEEFNPFAWMVASSRMPDVSLNDPDHVERSVGVPGPGLQFMVNGGIEVEYVTPMRPADVITSSIRLAGYEEREGRRGHMLLSKMEDVWTNQRQEIVKRCRSTLIRY